MFWCLTHSVKTLKRLLPGEVEWTDPEAMFGNAVVTIDRDPRGATSQGAGQILNSVLHRRLSTRLSKAGLTPEQIPEYTNKISKNFYPI